LRDSKLAAWRSASGDTKTTKKNNKPRVDYEPRSAHGRAVKKNKNKSRVDYETRSAHGRAVNKYKKMIKYNLN